jgi:hypothetical protein
MGYVVALLVASSLADLAGPTSAATAPLEMTAKLLRGELRVGSTATLLVTIRNRSQQTQKLGTFKGGGWELQGGTSGLEPGRYRNAKAHWRCHLRTTLKPGASDTFEYEVDMRDMTDVAAEWRSPPGSATLVLSLQFSYPEREHCVAQPLTWSGRLDALARQLPSERRIVPSTTR